MRYSFKKQDQWEHFFLEKDSINGIKFEWKKLQDKYYIRWENSLSWQRIYLPATPRIPRIINNESLQIFEGFIPSGIEGTAKGSLKTSMPGKIIKILVKPQDKIQANQTLIILEAMKMENEIKASADGLVKEIYVKENQLVDANVLLMEIL